MSDKKQIINCTVESCKYNDDNLCDHCNIAFSDQKDKVDPPVFVDNISLEELYQMIDDVVPDEITSDIRLPRGFDESLAFLYWYSSNEDAITSGGKVNRTYEDVPVSFRVVIKYSETEVYERIVNAVVKGFHLKPLENKKIVVAYLYASDGFSGINEESLQHVDYINYSFGGVVGGKAVVEDKTALRTVLSYRDQGVRVGLALGGWGSGDFSNAVRTPEARTIFADSIIELMKQYNFDGIDIDWEYPDSYDQWVNFGLFIADLREELAGSAMSVSIAASVTYKVPIFDVTDQLDFLMTMSYDDLGPQHASMQRFQGDANLCVEKFHMPKPRIVVGLPFYSNEQGKLTEQFGYSTIVGWYPNLSPAENTVRSKRQDGSPGPVHSFNVPQLISEKCRWMKQQKFGGVMIWAYDTDVKLGHRASLAKAMFKIVRQPRVSKK